MRTPAEMDFYAREIQHDHRAEAAREALARRLAPGPFDRLLAALRPRGGSAPTPAPIPPQPSASAGLLGEPRSAA